MSVPLIIICKCGAKLPPGQRMNGMCRSCYVKSPKMKAWRKNYYHQMWLKIKADSKKLAEWNKRSCINNKAFIERHKDYYKIQYAKLKADPIKYQ